MRKFQWPGKTTRAGVLALFSLLCIAAQAQDGQIKPVPILTGSTAYFTRVTGGNFQDVPSVSPLLLVPFGEKWLVEAKGNYSETFAKGDEGYYESTASYGLIYAQVDYLANRFVTLSAGRFTTPFGMYGERLAPNWIRALQVNPLTVPITSGSSLGGMLRGGFPAGTQKVNLNYAFYFSSNNTHHLLATDRSTGGRIGFFLPRQRLEIGASFQQLLQADRAHATGLHAEWQPNACPLTLRSEYAHSSGIKGSGYWVESVYRLRQVPYMRRLELAGRAQQFFADPKLTQVNSKIIKAQIRKLGPLGQDMNQGDFGLNYYLLRDVRASASYGRQFAVGKDANLWVVGLTYRFVMPLGPKGGAL